VIWGGGLIGYTGKYLVSLDDNGRVAIPAKLRKARPIGVSPKKAVKAYVLAKWLDGCLGLFIESEWIKKFNELQSEHSGMTREGRNFIRKLSTNTYEVVPDTQGRINIPRDLIQEADLKGETLMIGSTTHIEIWNPERFEKLSNANPSLENMLDQLFAKK